MIGGCGTNNDDTTTRFTQSEVIVAVAVIIVAVSVTARPH